jgi:D-glycero-alpha-D-manno-heptose-7-phosphate kinase
MMFQYLQEIQLHCSDMVAKAMECISRNIVRTGGYGIALVLDDDNRLVGVVTDGDIRRALLSGYTLDSTVDAVMTENPVTTTPGKNHHQLLRLFERGVRHVPVVDAGGHVVDLVLYGDLRASSGPIGTMLRAKVPLRISFAGGGTDMTPVFEKIGGAVISATIDRYCYAELMLRDDSQIALCSRDSGQQVTISSLNAIEYDGTLDLLKAAICVSEPNFGFELYTSSDVPPGSGLGGSAALTVAIIGLIDHVRSGQIDEYRIADLAFQAERVELGIRGGWQDQYAAVFGGLNYIEFDEEGVIVQPLRLTDRVRYELESNLVLCFTGQTRNSGDVHARIDQNDPSVPAEDFAEYSPMLDLVDGLRKALLKGNLVRFGYLLDQAWQAKKEMNRGVSNSWIDELYDLAKEHGALGGKLLGAGAGGYLLFYCDPFHKHEVQRALRQAGVEPKMFNLDFQGLRIWPSEKVSDQASFQCGL